VENRLNEQIIEILACPRCKNDLTDFICTECDIEFPLVNGLPILINEANSVFKFEDFVTVKETTYKKSSDFKQFVKRLIPSINLNVNSKQRFDMFFSRLKAEKPKILIVGGAFEGEGFKVENIPDDTVLLETDVAFGSRTNLICDGHDLPFKDESFDGVIIQAVLEHVLEPICCVSEIHRVLKHDGVVYSETPFMQQVHAGKFDFTRFTHLGHRRLFRGFSEIESGAACGTGMALTWSYCYFLQSFFTSKLLGQIAFAFGSLTSFWLKYFDYLLINKPGIYDAASGYYFLGQKSAEVLSDEELLKSYKGTIY
jgi:SAM-dependent methyltransferase